MAKKDVNSLKIMLAVTKQPFLNGAPTLANQTWKP